MRICKSQQRRHDALESVRNCAGHDDVAILGGFARPLSCGARHEGGCAKNPSIDASGRYLLAVGQLSHRLSSYTIDPDTGKLTKLKEYPMGKNPNWIEIVDLP